MSKCKSQCAVASHRNPADGAVGTSTAEVVFALDLRHELLQEEIAVAHGFIRGIDVEASPALGRHDQKVAHLALVTQIIQQSPAATVEQSLLVVAQSMQKIQNRITPRRVFLGPCVVARRNVNAISNRTLEDLAIKRAAINSALATRTNYDKE